MVVDIAIDKITSGHNKESENWNVETLLKMCFEARDLVIQCTMYAFLEDSKNLPRACLHVDMLSFRNTIVFRCGIQIPFLYRPEIYQDSC